MSRVLCISSVLPLASIVHGSSLLADVTEDASIHIGTDTVEASPRKMRRDMQVFLLYHVID